MSFSLEQIKQAHAKVKSGADFPNYIKDLITLGVSRYETYVSDGHSVYVGQDSFMLKSDPKYAVIEVAETSNKDQFVSDLRRHQQGGTDYPTFCNDCAKSGVVKWIVDLSAMTCTYFDKLGHEILVENIPQ